MKTWPHPIVLPMLLIAALAELPNPIAALESTPPNITLQRLKELDNPKLQPTQKAKLGLRLYRQEMLHPTPRPQPKDGKPSTDPVTHDYVLARVTEKLAAVGADPGYLKKAWQQAREGEVKESLAVFLALKGEAAVKEPVVALVTDPKKALRLRELGAKALGVLAVKRDDASLGQALAKAIREDSAGVYQARRADTASGADRGTVGNRDRGRRESAVSPSFPRSVSPSSPGSGKSPPRVGGPAGLVLVYPVRKAASEAIRKMEKAGLLLESYVTQAADTAVVEVPVSAGSRE